MIFTHPNNEKHIRAICMKAHGCFDPNRFGLEVTFSEHLPIERPTGRTIFPDWRFVEWEEDDAEWAVACGIARPEMTPYFICLNTEMGHLFRAFGSTMHPLVR